MSKDKPSDVEADMPDSVTENSDDHSSMAEAEANTATVKPRSGAMIAWIALLTAVGGIGAGYYLYRHTVAPLLPLPDSFAAYQQETNTRLSTQSERLEKTLQAVQQQAHLLQEAGELDQQRFHGIEQNLATVRGQAFWSTREWKLSEIKYLVQVAEDRMQLMQDVHTGETALLAALGRLAELADPTLEPLRQRLQHDLQRLAAPTDQDPLQQIGKLETLVASIKPYPRDPAPTAEDQLRPDAAQATTVNSDSPLNSLRSLLGGRIKIVHHNATLNPLEGERVAAHQLELLKMRIEALRLALIQKNRRFYEHELNGIKLWLKSNALGAQGQALTEEVEKLASLDPFVPLPSLQPTLDMISTLLATRIPAAGQPGSDS